MKRKVETINRLEKMGIGIEDGWDLLKIERQFHRWDERECGDQYGCIEWDDKTGKPFWRSMNGHIYPIRNMLKATENKLARIMANYPDLVAYHQSDPRGCSLYVVRKTHVGENIEANYTNGVAVIS